MINKIKYTLFFSFYYLIPYLLIGFLMTTLNKYITNEIISTLYDIIVSNSDVDVLAFSTISQTFNIINIFIYLLTFIIMLISIFIEYTLLLIIIKIISKFQTSEDSVIDILKVTIQKTISNINVKTMIFISIYYVFVVSFAKIPISNSLIDNIEISGSITSVIYSNILFTLFYLIFVFASLYVAYHFALVPIILINKNVSLKESFILNKELRINNKKYLIVIFFYLATLNIVDDLLDIYFSNEVLYDLYTSPSNVGVPEYLLLIIKTSVDIMYKFSPVLFLFSLERIYSNVSDNVYLDGDKEYITFKRLYLVISFLLISLMSINSYKFGSLDTAKNQVMVHRGGGFYAAENSAESLIYSIDNGFDYVEIDVVELKDETLILAHDLTLNRLSNKNVKLSDLTYSEIMNYKIETENGSFNFITLDEALTIGKGKLNFNIELKLHGNETDGFIDNLTNIIKSHSMTNDVYISSFDYNKLIDIENNDSDFKTMFFTFYLISDVDNLKTDALGIDIKYVSEGLLEDFSESEKVIAIYTINSKSEMFEVIEYNPDFIITDEPQLVSDLVNSIK